MKLDSKVELKHLKVDGGMTNGDMAMEVLADIGGFSVIRPEMREYVECFLFVSTYENGLSSGPPRSDQHFWQDQLCVSLAGISPSQKQWQM